MKSRRVVIGLGSVALVAALCLGLWIYVRASGLFGSPADTPFEPSLERGKVLAVSEYRFSGPYTHDNLTLYLVHGQPTLAGKSYLTLEEALEQKKVIVHETGEVNTLSIENTSDDEVFVQSGDVVKGGRQDRTFPYDFIAPAQSGKLPIDSFCVEQGRWSKRGKEESAYFSSSPVTLSGKSLKNAVVARSQHDVWENVDRIKKKLSSNLTQSVDSSASASSYPLALENTSLNTALTPYLETLRQAPKGQKDVLGVAILVNGKVMSVEVYASGALFAKLWPRLLKGAATEAFAELKKGASFPQASRDTVKAFLHSAENGAPATEAVTSHVYVHVQQTAEQILLDTCDRKRDNLVIHRSVLAR
jgi:hypothetical protein